MTTLLRTKGATLNFCPESFQVLSILASLSQMPPWRCTFLSTKQNCHYPCFGTKPRFSGHNSSRKAVFGHFPHVALEIPPVPFGMGLGYFHSIVSLPHPPQRASLTCSLPGLQAHASFTSPEQVPDPTPHLMRSRHLGVLSLPTAHCSHPQPLPPLPFCYICCPSYISSSFLMLHYTAPTSSLLFMTRDASTATKPHFYPQIL